MELHAWVNPFRAYLNVAKRRYIDPSHVWVRHPEWLVTYGERLYMDPGIPEAREYVLQVLLDILYRYDIDGLHIDDYFYPYRIQGQDFPDSLSYSRYGENFTRKSDWRRNNINSFIRSLRNHSQAVKPWVKLGISPFGVWRNKRNDPRGSDTRAGQTSYDDLFADIRGWLEKGWIDYVAPQIYWSIGYPPASYEVLLDWWSTNHFGKDLYIGKAAYKVGNNADKNWDDPRQLAKQVELDRENGVPGGSIYFSASSLLKNPLNVLLHFREDLYASPALPPPGPWTGNSQASSPEQVNVASHPGGGMVLWEPGEASYVGIYRFGKKERIDLRKPQYLQAVVSADQGYYLDPVAKGKYTYVITGFDRFFQESSERTTQQVKVKRR